jgi:putative chitobiose transport system permease protein
MSGPRLLRNLRTLGLYLLLAGLALFATVPFLWLLSTSLKSGDVFTSRGLLDLIPREPTLEYYVRLLGMSEQLPLLRFFWNTALICVWGVVLEVSLAALAAYPLARMEFKGKTLVFALLLSTLMLPTQANMIVNFVTIRWLGLFNTLSAVVLPAATSVFGIFLMRQAFLVVPRELEDAARIDGCGELGIFWHVMLPLSRAALGTLALFAFVSHWNSFLWPLVVLKSAELYPLSVGMAYMAETFDSDFRLVAAGSVAGMLPILILFLLVQKQFIRGITAGAVK